MPRRVGEEKSTVGAQHCGEVDAQQQCGEVDAQQCGEVDAQQWREVDAQQWSREVAGPDSSSFLGQVTVPTPTHPPIQAPTTCYEHLS